MIENLKAFLDAKVAQYNQPGFIANDPIVIPHMFSQKQDIEIMGFWAATLAWGQRVTIINKCKELIGLMDGAPYDFITNHEEPDLKKLLSFKHRTFNDIDTLYFIAFFRYHYESFDSLEDAFTKDGGNGVEDYLNNFRKYFFSLPDFPHRTRKHVSSPSQKSTCKRLNMFLRWMVRKDDHGVDFGIWNKIKPVDLIMPCDLHVDRVARKLNLITRKQTDWQTAVELTMRLKEFDPLDPVKYDFALFGLGIEEKF
ncbi:TIGR02757 family protein [Mucilaginibacter myungsuensis]|uniref:TIGR02757 family protein n=1 Tax=Mucilaginibacter myungsuensis TaxID=649104 RepID=A0A929PXW6_9SPHI|nr:TIGR02757 family protein [Mucilaginibacter myungsuensis]MBE9663606.1 TIGR02757 family protein [Mucilaginibacter myungsuensis]MDN3599070.1 TIGR02757 family protein [Mucilaginibacter myungsuensis]